MARKKSGNLDGDDYRKGALERQNDAYILLRAGLFAGAASNAGRAVEGMLRAVIWKRDMEVLLRRKSLETGHDLRELLLIVQNLGILPVSMPDSDRIVGKVQQIARLWFNNMRFASSRFVETRWLGLGEIRKGWTFKQAVQQFYSDCSDVIQRCEVLCRR